MDKEWWIKLAEEVLGRKIKDEEIKFEFDALELEEGESVLISDITEKHEYLFGFRMASAILWQILKKDFKNMTVAQLIPTMNMVKNSGEFFWDVLRFNYPDAQNLRLGTWQGKIAIINSPHETKDDSLMEKVKEMMRTFGL